MKLNTIYLQNHAHKLYPSMIRLRIVFILSQSLFIFLYLGYLYLISSIELF